MFQQRYMHIELIARSLTRCKECEDARFVRFSDLVLGPAFQLPKIFFRLGEVGEAGVRPVGLEPGPVDVGGARAAAAHDAVLLGLALVAVVERPSEGCGQGQGGHGAQDLERRNIFIDKQLSKQVAVARS